METFIFSEVHTGNKRSQVAAREIPAACKEKKSFHSQRSQRLAGVDRDAEESLTMEAVPRTPQPDFTASPALGAGVGLQALIFGDPKTQLVLS